MSRKNILIVNPIALYPKVMGSQDRVVTMAKVLAADHNVDLVTLVRSAKSAELSKKALKTVCRDYYPVFARNTSFLRRKVNGVLYLMKYFFRGQDRRHFYWGGKSTNAKICEIVSKKKYDIIQIEFWYQGEIFDCLKGQVYKVLDTVDVLFDKKKLEFIHRYGKKIPIFRKRELRSSEQAEREIISKADIVISISEQDRKRIEGMSPSKHHVTIPMGQDIDYYKNYPLNPDPKTVLFYGSLSGEQNIVAFWRLYSRIFPVIRRRISDVKLLIVGAKPPPEILKLHDGANIEVTGYVDDVRGPLAKGWLAIIPLDIAAGFRGRIIELMAMGIPVIGTHNAMDCVGIRNKIHGFISDDDGEMGEMAVSLLTDMVKRAEISKNCQGFVSEKYSLAATYGKLADLYSRL